MNLRNSNFLIWFIMLLTGLFLIIDLPKNYHLKIKLGNQQIDQIISSPVIDFKFGNLLFKRDLDIKKGLDIQGGTHLVLDADMTAIKPEDRKQALEGAKDVVNRRVDLYGVSEPLVQTIQTENTYRVTVDLPGMKNINDAIDLIGQTAQLDFRELPEELKNSTEAAELIINYKKTELTGSNLKRAEVQFSPQTGEPTVGIQFDNAGTEKFGQITTRNVGKRLAIFLDNIPLTAPTVNEPIVSGNAVITGKFTLSEAKKLVIQLNAGALPIPLKVIEQRTIGPSLGREAVNKSVIAGIIGLIIVALFMIANYGFLGLLADIALMIYGLITLGLYKLIPITLSLPGIAGFLLSVGMAVDSNILIFERMKEEKWLGKPLSVAMELGFGRAWDSIKDANVCTLITSFILFNPLNWSFLNTSGLVRGFALTLGLGIFISLFTGIVVTRTLIRLFYRSKDMRVG